MSGLGTNCSVTASAGVDFFSLAGLGCSERQSATAATATNTSALAACAITASCISRAVVTSSRRTPRGVGSLVGPLTSVTSAPASRAARAIA